MGSSFLFVTNSVLLGIGLAADAFSVSVVNGTADTNMKSKKAFLIAGTFALFQALMPLTGWFMSSKLISGFTFLKKFVPVVSQVLLMYLGMKIIVDGVEDRPDDDGNSELDLKTLFVQAFATSVDALMAGLTIAEYGFVMALVCSCIIAAVTFVICFVGVHLGRGLGMKLLGKATLFGGLMLIFIAIENFIRTFFI